YPALAVLLRARMANLPAPAESVSGHGGDDRETGLQALAMLAQLIGEAPFGTSRLSWESTLPLPAKRAKAERPAPVYQLKVGLRGAKPPIWRRIQLPADTGLGRLHEIIQVAFGWDGGHLHAFTTPYGEFGRDDPDLEQRPEGPVTLEQVAPGVQSKITYTYDFGDGWEHEIRVERVLEPAGVARRPRCVGGRRAAPPDDCGGIWGYAELAEILADPAHPEHEDRLDWLGLDDAAQFDPGRFHVDAVNDRLAALR
ncbi:MAG: plasmid pRiA4b ORF-3 family protein, partial [Trebonia sp.]